MEALLYEIYDLLKDGDGHFVLAIGRNNDWVAMIEKDEQPDSPTAWGAGDSGDEAIDNMLRNVNENSVSHSDNGVQ